MMKRIIKIIISVILIAGVICTIGVYKYVSNVPKLSPKYKCFAVASGISCSIEEMVDVTCNGDYLLRASILDSNVPNASIAEDKKSIYTGDASGYIHIEILGIGTKSEGGKPVDIYLLVGLNSDEQSRITEISVQNFKNLDRYLHEDFFTEENNTEFARSRFTSCYSTENAFGVQRDMTEELFSDYISEFKDAKLEGLVIMYNRNSLSASDATGYINYYALYKTTSGKKLYLTISSPENETFENTENCFETILEEAPDSAGNRTYDVLENQVRNTDTSIMFDSEFPSIKIGDNFIISGRNITIERYDKYTECDSEMISYDSHYVFIAPLP